MKFQERYEVILGTLKNINNYQAKLCYLSIIYNKSTNKEDMDLIKSIIERVRK